MFTAAWLLCCSAGEDSLEVEPERLAKSVELEFVVIPTLAEARRVHGVVRAAAEWLNRSEAAAGS